MKNAAKKAASKATEEHGGAGKFVLPWLVIGALLGLGHLLHKQLGTELPAAPLAVLFVTVGGTILGVLTWRYALPRGVVIQWHAAVSVAIADLLLIMIIIFGVSRLTFWLFTGVGALFALSWNIRRLEVIRGEGHDAHNKDVLTELGLTVKSKKVVTDTADRKEVKLKLGDGQTVETVQKQLGAIGSHAGALRKSVRAVAGEYEGEVTLSMAFRDVLKETIPWPGPSHPGGSIGDGFNPALYEDALHVWIYLAGNYKKNIAPGHMGICGMPRSGKGAWAHVLIADLCTRRDVFLCVADTRKGKQFTGPIERAIGWYVDSDNAVRAQLKAFERAMEARNKALGEAGYSSWTPKAYTDPKLRMPGIICWMEEAAAVLDDNARLVVELGEAMLSAGMWLVLSAQRWTGDRVPTSVRSSITNAVVFGTQATEDATYLLSGGTIEAGIDPGEWKTRFPGRHIVEVNGVDPSRFPVPAKGYLGEFAQLKAVTDEWGPRMAKLDPVTLAAFGKTYTPYNPDATTLPAVIQQRTAGEIEFDDEDDDDRPYQPTEEEEAQFMVPEIDDQELAAMARTIDPKTAVMPEWQGPEFDMTPPTNPNDREWTKEEKVAEFERMLEALADDGRTELSTDELSDEWEKRVGEGEAQKRWFMFELIAARIENGQMERAGRGKYRITFLTTVGAPHSS
jgi:hypothetical protein